MAEICWSNPGNRGEGVADVDFILHSVENNLLELWIRSRPTPSWTSQGLQDKIPNPSHPAGLSVSSPVSWLQGSALSPLFPMFQPYWISEAPHCPYNTVPSQHALPLAWLILCLYINMTSSGRPSPTPPSHELGSLFCSHSTLYFLLGALIAVGNFYSMPTYPTSLVAPWRQGPCLSCSLPYLAYIRHSRNVSVEPPDRWPELVSSVQKEAAM